jgi:hypothetical protein
MRFPATSGCAAIISLVLFGWSHFVRAQPCCMGPCSSFGLEKSCALPGAAAAEAQRPLRPTRATRVPSPAPPKLMPAPIEERPLDDEGYDARTLPGRAPDGDWLTLIDDDVRSGLFVDARINDIDVVAKLDTGCTRTVIDTATAQRLGIVRDDRLVGEVDVDVFGETSRGRVYWAPLELGSWKVEQTKIDVIDVDVGVILIGSSVLSQFDLYIAPDEGLVGLFEPEQPSPKNALVVELRNNALGTPVVLGAMPHQSPQWFTLDTGAAVSVVPSAWVRGRPEVSKHWTTMVNRRYLASRFNIDLFLGSPGLNVGGSHASAIADNRNIGLDVLRRFHVVLSPTSKRLSLAQRPRPPAWRSHGVRGANCTLDGVTTPCISVSLKAGSTDAAPQLCATLGPAAPRGQVALDVAASHADGRAAWGGGWATLYLPAGRGWRTTCQDIPLEGPLWSFDVLELVRVRRVRTFWCPGGQACLSRGAPLP